MIQKSFLTILFYGASVFLYAANPISIDSDITIDEDSEYSFDEDDFNFFDADGDAFKGILIETEENKGDLECADTNAVIDNLCEISGGITFIPTTNDFGQNYTYFDYRVVDVNDDVSDNVYRMVIHVSAENDLPNLSNTVIYANEDGDFYLENSNFEDGFQDPDGDAIEGIKILSVSNELTLILSDAVVSIPSEIDHSNISKLIVRIQDDWSGTGIIRWIGKDAEGYSRDTAEVSVIVRAVNDPPVLDNIGEYITIQEDSEQYTIAVTGIGDGDEDQVQSILITNVSSSDTNLIKDAAYTSQSDSEGEISFTPKADAYGDVKLTFLIRDGGGTSNGGIDSISIVYNITIEEVNDPPRSRDTTIAIYEDHSFYNFSRSIVSLDEDSLTHSIILNALPVGGSCTYQGQSCRVNVIYSELNQLIYMPEENVNGSKQDSLTYYIIDSDGAKSDSTYTTSFNVLSVNDAPVGRMSKSDTTLSEDTSEQSFEITEVGDGDFDVVQSLSFEIYSSDLNIITDYNLEYIEAENKVLVTYTPVADAYGTVVLSTFIKDNGGVQYGGSNEQRFDFTIQILPENDLPLSADTTLNIYEDRTQSIDESVIQFHDVDGDALRSVWLVSVPEKGELFFDQNSDGLVQELEKLVVGAIISNEELQTGLVKYISNPNEYGTNYASLLYKVSDGIANSGFTYSLQFNVLPVNDAPWNVERPGVQGVYEVDSVLQGFGGTWNDSLDGDSSNISYLYQWFIAEDTLGTNAAPVGDPQLTYQISRYDVGYYVCMAVYATDDGYGLGTPNRIENSPWVLIPNHAPQFSVGEELDAGNVSEDMSLEINISATDRDRDVILWSLYESSTRSVVSFAETGIHNTFTYNPVKDFFGRDSFVIQVQDDKGDYDRLKIYVNVLPEEDAPEFVSMDTLVYISEDGFPKAFDLVLQGRDGDLDEFSWRISKQAIHGVAETEGVGEFKAIDYVPDANFNGLDSFYVSVYNESGEDTLKVIVNVESVNDAPLVTQGKRIEVEMDEDSSPQKFELILNATDDSKDSITWSLARNAVRGNALVSGVGEVKSIAYFPHTDFFGLDSFQIKLKDGAKKESTVWVVVYVNAINDLPSLNDVPSLEINEGEVFPEIILDNYILDRDDGYADIVWSVKNNTALQFEIDAARKLHLSPIDNNWNGEEAITLMAKDSYGDSALTSIQLTVHPVNDAPVFTRLPEVEGDYIPGQKVLMIPGEWNDSADGDTSVIFVNYTWQRSAYSNGVLPESIGDGVEYLVQESDSHQFIRLMVEIWDNESVENNKSIAYTNWVEVDSPVQRIMPRDTIRFDEDIPKYITDIRHHYNDMDNSNDSITIAVESFSNPTGVFVYEDQNRIHCIPSLNFFGSGELVVKVESYLSVLYDTIPVVVQAVDDPPFVSDALEKLTFFKGVENYSIDLKAYFEDVDDTLFTYDFSHSNPVLFEGQLDEGFLNLNFNAMEYGESELVLTAQTGDEVVQDTIRIIVFSDGTPTLVHTPITDIQLLEDHSTWNVDLSQTMVLQSTVEDVQLSLLTGFDTTLVHITLNNDVLSITPKTDANGKTNIVIRGEYRNEIVLDTAVVEIVPVNDFPAIEDMTLYVNGGHNIGSILGIVPATDIDGDSLTFTLTDLTGSISIDSNNGAVFYERELVFNQELTSHIFEVEVCDEELCDDAILTLMRGEGNSAPILLDTTITFEQDIPENTLIAELSAYDADSNDVLVYKNLDLNEFIVSADGQVHSSIVIPKGYEYSLRVEVSDGELKDTALVHIHVIDNRNTVVVKLDTIYIENFDPLEKWVFSLGADVPKGSRIVEFVNQFEESSLSILNTDTMPFIHALGFLVTTEELDAGNTYTFECLVNNRQGEFEVIIEVNIIEGDSPLIRLNSNDTGQPFEDDEPELIVIDTVISVFEFARVGSIVLDGLESIESLDSMSVDGSPNALNGITVNEELQFRINSVFTRGTEHSIIVRGQYENNYYEIYFMLTVIAKPVVSSILDNKKEVRGKYIYFNGDMMSVPKPELTRYLLMYNTQGELVKKVKPEKEGAKLQDVPKGFYFIKYEY